MLNIDRKQVILKRIQKEKTISFDELSKTVDVSVSTIRRDIAELMKNYPISFIRGGAIYNDDRGELIDLERMQQRELIEIGNKAFGLLSSGDTIIIDGGYTAFHLAKAIELNNINNLTVVTTSIAVANTLRNKQANVNLVLVGGEYRNYYRSLTGRFAEETVRSIKANKAFISVSGLSEKGFYTTFLSEMSLRNKVCEASQEVIVMAHEKKFGNEAGFLVGSLESISKIITNKMPGNMYEILSKKNVEIIY